MIGNTLWSDQFNPARITGFLGLNYAWVLMVLSPWLFEGCRLLDKRGLAYWVAIPLLFAAVILGGSRASGLLLVISVLSYATLIGVRLGVSASCKFLVPVFVSLVGSGRHVDSESRVGRPLVGNDGGFSWRRRRRRRDPVLATLSLGCGHSAVSRASLLMALVFAPLVCHQRRCWWGTVLQIVFRVRLIIGHLT